MVRVYRKSYFSIYSDFNGSFVIHNTRKEFSEGHTHMRELSTAQYMVNLALHKSLPKRNLKYFIESLIRISDDPKYIDKLKNLSYTQLHEKKKYKKKERATVN